MSPAAQKTKPTKKASKTKPAKETKTESVAEDTPTQETPDPSTNQPKVEQPQATQSENVVKPLEDNTMNEATTTPKDEPKPKKKRGKLFKFIIFLLVLFLLFILAAGAAAGAAYMYFYPKAQQAQQTTTEINQQMNQLKVAIKGQNLTQTENELNNLKNSLASLNGQIQEFAWAKDLPYVTEYWHDGHHLTTGALAMVDAGQIGVVALKPYADLLGFTIEEASSESQQPDQQDGDGEGENSENQEAEGDEAQDSEEQPKEPETAKDRIQFVVETLDAVVPEMDRIAEQLALADENFSKIDANRYPEELQGFPVRSQIQQIKDITDQATVLVTDARPLLEVAPYILGTDGQRTYLVLFQNDAELRPTGGFITAYALLTVEKGNIKPQFSKDIYDLDNKYNSKIDAPQPLIDYIPDPYAKEQAAGITPKLRLRDSNISPDFRESMELFYEEYLKTGGQEVDGIIAVDTKFLLGLLEVTGPIGVGGIGNFSSEIVPECNCPQVVYELESAISYATPYIRQNRKAIIGPLMHSILANAMGTPKEKMSQLIQAGLDGVQGKHILMYFRDPEVQQALEAFNLAGRVAETSGDYLMVIDTNFAGAKSNLYVTDEVDLIVTPEGDSTINELTITYKNPQKHDGWLNGDFRNWVRIYVPEGSELIEDTGSETAMETNSEFDKTVFSGFIVVRPEGLATLKLKYKTPAGTDPYTLLVQKQAGTENFYYTVNMAGNVQEFELDEDKLLEF